MGERKGQNKYYPPDFDYKKHKTLNGYHGVHALRERGTKAHLGVIIIRFEMPFNIWCLGCGNHIGMGVRYNAEKRKVGMYYTTPLYEFKMKCALCPQKFTIRTDPKNFDYELVDGCRRQERRFDSGELDNVGPVDRGLAQKLDADPMLKVEHQTTDKQKATSAEDAIKKLERIQNRLRDDFSANAGLRNTFRTEKKHLTGIKISEDEMKSRLSIDVPLLPENDDDKRMARQLMMYKGLGKNPMASEPAKNSADEVKVRLERKLFKRGSSIFGGNAGSPSFVSKAAKIGTCLVKHKRASEEATSSEVKNEPDCAEATEPKDNCLDAKSKTYLDLPATEPVKSDVEDFPRPHEPGSCSLVAYDGSDGSSPGSD